MCPYRSAGVTLAEVFNQLIDNTSEKFIHTEERVLSGTTRLPSCKSISSVDALENNGCYGHFVLISIHTKSIYSQMMQRFLLVITPS